MNRSHPIAKAELRTRNAGNGLSLPIAIRLLILTLAITLLVLPLAITLLVLPLSVALLVLLLILTLAVTLLVLPLSVTLLVLLVLLILLVLLPVTLLVLSWGIDCAGAALSGILSGIAPRALLHLLCCEGAPTRSLTVDLAEGLGGYDRVITPLEGRNLYVGVLRAITWIRVIAEDGRATRTILGLNRFEELGKAAGVVAGVIEDVDSQQVRLLFVGTRHSQEIEALTNAESSLSQLPARAVAEENLRSNLSQTVEDASLLLLGHVAGGVAHDHVTQLVSHHTCQLGLSFSRLNRTQVDENSTSGDREGVDISTCDHMEVEWPLLSNTLHEGRLLHETVPEHLNITRDGVVVGKYGHLLEDFGDYLVACGYLLLGCKGVFASHWLKPAPCGPGPATHQQ